VFALAATNAVSVLLFGTLYAVAGAGRLSQGAFLACLGVLFALATALWVRVESRHRAFEPLRRLRRVAAGLVAIVIGTPMLVLMPLFWLDTKLPPEAGLNRLLAPIMTLVLISLVLVVLVNVAGAGVATGLTVANRPRTAQRS
jgi:Flp pilus assembly protein TadB